ncbi:MAG TPA: HlyD family secretion protein [Bryobacteraceae bacterium]|nr:HlyD family secretion protein [Bryobacteraceae bacterium]
MSDTTNPTDKRQRWVQRLKQLVVPVIILLMAGGLVMMIAGNWNTWTSQQVEQKTDDAYLRADLTPLSSKVAGLVAKVAVSDYQAVKAGDLLVQLQDDDFRAQVQQAQAAVAGAENSLIHNRRQKELQDARIAQASDGIRAAEADITAAEAGITAANATVASARSGVEAIRADVQRTLKERHRQEALIASESGTRQKLEQAVADEERYRAQVSSREADMATAESQLASRKADLERARAKLASSKSELEAQKRQRAVLDSQELLLRADLNGKKASLALAATNLGYTRIAAPENGIVSERKVRPGQLVSPGTQVLSLVQTDLWVQANYKETQVRHIRPGDPAELRVDAFPGVTFKGKVDQLSPASGSQFALLPPDNATGNFTKIVQRVPVKIVLDRNQTTVGPLRPGMSVIATVYTHADTR